MQVNQKYLKDENGNNFSPITSVNSIYNEEGESLNSILTNDAYFYSTLSTTQNFSVSEKNTIHFTSYDSYFNMSLNNYTFTINSGGIYLINLFCRFAEANGVESGTKYRLLVECNITNNRSDYSLSKYRCNDSEYRNLGGDSSKLCNWIIKLQSNAQLTFTIYPIGAGGELKGIDDTTDTDGVRATYVFIKKLGNYRNT